VTLLLSINSAGDSWSPQRWSERFQNALPNHRIVVDGADAYVKAEVRYAAVWKPAAGFLAQLPNLAVIFNLGAGVDALLSDPALPDVPLVRVVNVDLTRRMTEYVTLHVLLHHRRMPKLLRAQAAQQWLAKDQPAASAVRVGIMGMGTLGRDAAEVLSRLGFQVAGWSRSTKPNVGVATYAGAEQLPAFLARTDILVVLLPLTPATAGILDCRIFAGLARDGVLGAPVLINAGRGGLQREADILAALDDGTLGAASLDVFETEPLPQASRLWTHPDVIVTPHNAADSDPDAIAADVAAQVLAFQSGGALRNVVMRAAGY
jgi:glyoxylate/hydroxypyruvate reductase